MEFAGPEPEVQPGEEEEVSKISDPYLADFVQLGPQIYMYTPAAPSVTEIDDTDTDTAAETQQQGQQEPLDPDLIIICSWMYAQSRNIVKYTKVYQSTYPSSPILLLRQDGGDFFFRTQAQQMRNLEPAVSVIHDLSTKTKEKKKKKNEEQNGDRPRVLLHIFSNGGAWTACQLADAYHQRNQPVPPALHDEEKDPLLPVTALVLDSTPSLPNSTASHTAICEALPKSPPALRALGSALVWGYLGLSHAVGAVTGWENVTLSIRRRLNDPRGPFTRPPLIRVYIYSQADALIPAAEVEMHAQEAAQVMGSCERVRLEDFGTSRHVGHVLADPKRYWGVIGALWRESVGGGGGDGKAVEKVNV